MAGKKGSLIRTFKEKGIRGVVFGGPEAEFFRKATKDVKRATGTKKPKK